MTCYSQPMSTAKTETSRIDASNARGTVRNVSPKSPSERGYPGVHMGVAVAIAMFAVQVIWIASVNHDKFVAQENWYLVSSIYRSALVGIFAWMAGVTVYSRNLYQSRIAPYLAGVCGAASFLTFLLVLEIDRESYPGSNTIAFDGLAALSLIASAIAAYVGMRVYQHNENRFLSSTE